MKGELIRVLGGSSGYDVDKKEICNKCEYQDTMFCCFYDKQCDNVEFCSKVACNTADAKIRVRAKRMLRRHGIGVDNNTNNSTLVLLVKMFRHMMRLEHRTQSNKKFSLHHCKQ